MLRFFSIYTLPTFQKNTLSHMLVSFDKQQYATAWNTFFAMDFTVHWYWMVYSSIPTRKADHNNPVRVRHSTFGIWATVQCQVSPCASRHIYLIYAPGVLKQYNISKYNLVLLLMLNNWIHLLVSLKAIYLIYLFCIKFLCCLFPWLPPTLFFFSTWYQLMGPR